MELTGKCKEEFEKWLGSQTRNTGSDIHKWYVTWARFYIISDSAKWGVYVDFFDSVGINITDYVRFYEISWSGFVSDICEGKYHNKGRQYSRLKAIEKANEIYNDAH